VEFFSKFFVDEANSSAEVAKKRLISVLIHDRTDISPALLTNLRADLAILLTKYMDIDESNIEINLDHDDDDVSLVASVPVRKVRRDSKTLGCSGEGSHAAEKQDSPVTTETGE